MRDVIRVCALLLGVVPAMGFAWTPQPGFNMLWVAGSADLIVVGRFEADQSFTVSRVISGASPKEGKLQLANTKWVVPHFKEILKIQNSPELVLFLGRKDREQYYVGPTNVIAFDHDGATWASLNDWSMAGNSFQKHPAGSKEQFMTSLRTSLEHLNQFKAILARPRSAGRVEAVVSFLRAHWKDVQRANDPETIWLRGWRGDQSYYLAQFCETLRNHPTFEEFGALMDAVESSSSDPERAAFIHAVQNAAWANHADVSIFDRMKRWVLLGNTWMTRQEAFSAVVALDYQKGIELLIPFLDPSDPQVFEVLSGLTSVRPMTFPHEKLRWPKNVIEPIRLLAERLEPVPADHGSETATFWGLLMFEQSNVPVLPGLGRVLYNWVAHEPANQGRVLAWTLDFFSHPQLIGELWSWDPRHFRSMLAGRSNVYREASLSEAVTWLKKYGKAMARTYDLQQQPPLDWFREFSSGDALARQMLLRLWQYEDDIDEASLLQQAIKGPFAEEAKLLLSDLWEHKMLSPKTRHAIVQRFISYSFDTGPMKNRDRPQLFLVMEKTFPFPAASWADSNWDCGVDRPAVGGFDKDHGGSSSLKGRGTTRSWLYNVSDPAKEKVHVVIENWERDIFGTGEELWRAHWELKWPGKG